MAHTKILLILLITDGIFYNFKNGAPMQQDAEI
jgi:hypothetical protein